MWCQRSHDVTAAFSFLSIIIPAHRSYVCLCLNQLEHHAQQSPCHVLPRARVVAHDRGVDVHVHYDLFTGLRVSCDNLREIPRLKTEAALYMRYIYEDGTLINLDHQARGKLKQIGPGGHEGLAHEGRAHKNPGRPRGAWLIRAQGRP